ncbi:hypothetical protein ACTDI4_16340 [Mesorhizobium sp. PUT5]|uniref:hypothetical protein n=1 Tax=Mesorhizobium sp. PUT5 TaxID=3454629 RepID=UPI003FA42B5D
MDIQDIVNTIANSANIDPATTEKAVGTILSVLQHEAAGTSLNQLFDKMPGSADLAQKYDVMAANAGGGGGGLLGSLENALGGVLGEKAGALVNGIAQLKASGLDMEQIRQAGEALIKQIQVAAGPQLTDKVLGQVPSLKGQLGLS